MLAVELVEAFEDALLLLLGYALARILHRKAQRMVVGGSHNGYGLAVGGILKGVGYEVVQYQFDVVGVAQRRLAAVVAAPFVSYAVLLGALLVQSKVLLDERRQQDRAHLKLEDVKLGASVVHKLVYDMHQSVYVLLYKVQACLGPTVALPAHNLVQGRCYER